MSPLPQLLRNPSSPLEQIPIITVVGMPHSGTSAVTGMLEDHGLYLGHVRRGGKPSHPKGNRENPRVNKLNEAVLAYNGGAWWRPPPPQRIRFTRGHVRRRNRLLAEYGRAPFVIKDPRLLLLLDFWRDVLTRPIGVIRNPIAVMHSLRSRRVLFGALSDDEHLELWKAYNRPLLHELRERRFPIIDFEHRESLSDQVAAALRHYGFAPKDRAEFFDPGVVRHEVDSWRDAIRDSEVLELWDELVTYV